MANYQHDALDWFAAIGPTIAALAAAGATFFTARVARQIHREGQRAQRQLMRPRLVFRNLLRTNPNGAGLQWSVRVRNHGQSAAQITRSAVLIGGTPIEVRPTESMEQFWTQVLKSQGVVEVSGLLSFSFMPPVSLGGGADQRLVEAILLGDEQVLRLAASRIETRITYESAFGERWTESSVSGELLIAKA
jgi:hypothetical protein